MRTREALRMALAKADRSGTGRPYPVELRREALRYVEARRQEGATRVEAASELGVSAESIARWSARAFGGAGGVFREVEVMAPSSEPRGEAADRRQLIVHCPHGVRIEGLDIAGVAELLRRLA